MTGADTMRYINVRSKADDNLWPLASLVQRTAQERKNKEKLMRLTKRDVFSSQSLGLSVLKY